MEGIGGVVGVVSGAESRATAKVVVAEVAR